jgi:hypothetical protein
VFPPLSSAIKESTFLRWSQTQVKDSAERWDSQASVTAFARASLSPRLKYILFLTAAWTYQSQEHLFLPAGDWGHCQIIFTFYFVERLLVKVSHALAVPCPPALSITR